MFWVSGFYFTQSFFTGIAVLFISVAAETEIRLDYVLYSL